MDIERIVREVKAEAEQILGSGSGFSASQSFTPMTGYSGPASGDAARIVQEVKEEVSRLGGLGGQIDYQTPAAGSTVHSYMSPESLAGYIDHTLLKAEATEDDIRKLCDEAKRYHLIYNILKESDPDAALMHAELYLALKLENGGEIESDIGDLCLDEDSLDITKLEKEVREYRLRI